MRKRVALTLTSSLIVPAIVFGFAGPAMAYDDAVYFAFGSNWTTSGSAGSVVNEGQLGFTNHDSLTSRGYTPVNADAYVTCVNDDPGSSLGSSYYYYHYTDTRFRANVSIIWGTQAPAGHPTSRMNVVLVDPATGTSDVVKSFDNTMSPNTQEVIDFSLTWGNLSPSPNDFPNNPVPDRALKVVFQMDQSLSTNGVYVITNPIKYTTPGSPFTVAQPC